MKEDTKESSFKTYVDTELSFRARHRKIINFIIFSCIGVSGYFSFQIAKNEGLPGMLRLILAIWSLLSFFIVLAYVTAKIYPGGLSLRDSLTWRGWLE